MLERKITLKNTANHFKGELWYSFPVHQLKDTHHISQIAIFKKLYAKQTFLGIYCELWL